MKSTNAFPVRFVIAGTPRSGTNWLLSALNSHPRIQCHGELLDDPHLIDNPGFAADPWAGLERLFSSPPNGVNAVGFKLFYFHCWDYYTEHRGVLDRLGADQDLRVIFLTRQNLLRLALSWATARETRQWRLASNRQRAPQTRCMLDPDALLRQFHAIEAGVERLDCLFRKQRRVNLTYEQLFSDVDGSLKQILDLLGAEHRRIRGVELKQETRTFREAIANYDEVATTLAGTPYARFLDA